VDSILVQDRLNTVDQKLLNTDNGSVYHHLQKANMRLAEDRVLSFIIVFGTGELFNNISIGRFYYRIFHGISYRYGNKVGSRSYFHV